jgi:hypothetical protein
MIVEWMTIIAIFFSLPSIMLSWSPYILWAREGCWQEDWALIEQSHWDRKAGAKIKKKIYIIFNLNWGSYRRVSIFFIDFLLDPFSF